MPGNNLEEGDTMPTWVLVADTSRARIFHAEKAASPIEEVQTLAFPEARLRQGDLNTDRGGRGHDPSTGGHGINGEGGVKQEHAERFANLICNALETARLEGAFKKLYVIAAPSFLGVLRKQLSASLRQLVAGEVDKNLTTQSPTNIRKNLPDFL
ncbi:host attachment protein [Marichromatium gracile]|uniref:host attachment protein n=1 Tax=Marichromatium TaxID=85076 RepID=UPI001F3C3043|nr:host attachment protein [Marichromatium gracile]MCF1183243.1 host attachment protein [Marichromatium gracile]